MRRILRRLVRPVSRPAMLFLIWTKRHALRQWATSIRGEFGRGKVDTARLKTLARSLYALSTDAKIANSPQLRGIRVIGDMVEIDADPNWAQLPAARAALLRVQGVSRVEVQGASTGSRVASSNLPGDPDGLDALLSSGVASGV